MKNADITAATRQPLYSGWEWTKVMNGKKLPAGANIDELKKWKEECLICKAPLEYFETDIPMEYEISAWSFISVDDT